MKIGVAFGSCIILISIFAGERGLPAVFQARRRARELAAQVQALKAENARLRARVEALTGDPGTIEILARETSVSRVPVSSSSCGPGKRQRTTSRSTTCVTPAVSRDS